jgi:hypothetical protein
MPSETTAKQNAVIWSAAGCLILLLFGVIGWLINNKDVELTSKLNTLLSMQTKAADRAEEADRKILESVNKVCERLGAVEGRVGVLELQMPMKWEDRMKYFYAPRENKPTLGGKQ